MAVDKVVGVIAMGDFQMPAAWTVDVILFVTAARVSRRAFVGIGRRYFQRAFIDVIPMFVMQVAVMQVVRVSIVLDSRMAAAGTMLMRVTLDFRAGIHL
jgi:hypothetical protein